MANCRDVNREITALEITSISFKQRAELFKESVEEAAKRFMVGLDVDYIQQDHDYHVVIKDKVDIHNEVYYHTLTQEEF